MEPDITIIAALIGDPSRSRMLLALMSGKALTATELALEADITAQTASGHLAKLVESQLLIVRKQGRHKYFQLNGQDVAQLIEQLMNLSVSINPAAIATGPADQDLRDSRICYDHLAGSLGVSLYDSLIQEGHLLGHGENTELTESGKEFFARLGVNFDDWHKSKRPLCKACLDWSERRNHLAGKLGNWIIEDVFSKKWAVKDLDSRIVRFSPAGLEAFCKKYKIART